MNSRLLRIPEASQKTGIPEATLRWMRHVNSGPKSFKLAGRIVYKEADVEAWIEEQYRAQTKATA